jgi:hypothetical protein
MAIAPQKLLPDNLLPDANGIQSLQRSDTHARAVAIACVAVIQKGLWSAFNPNLSEKKNLKKYFF